MPDRARTEATQHAPAQGVESHAESREETVDRALAEQRRVNPAAAERNGIADDASRDPSTRRGINRRLARAAAGYGAVGFAAGVVLGLLLQLTPIDIGPGGGDLGSAGEEALYLGVFGIGFAMIFMVISAFVVLAREDGRVVHDVDRSAGEQTAEVGPRKGRGRGGD